MLGVNDYPYDHGCTAANDPWGYTVSQCTSFCAWRANNDFGVPFHCGSYCWGNANTWAARAAAQGVPVDNAPERGAIAATTDFSFGHVAVVLEVGPSPHCAAGSVFVEDYNWNLDCHYHQHCIPASRYRFIHLGRVAGPPPPPPPDPTPVPVPPVPTCPAGYALSPDGALCLPVGGSPAASDASVVAGLILAGGALAGGLYFYERRHPGSLAGAERRAEQLLAGITHPSTAGPGGTPRAEVYRR
jgi:surface antigen